MRNSDSRPLLESEQHPQHYSGIKQSIFEDGLFKSVLNGNLFSIPEVKLSESEEKKFPNNSILLQKDENPFQYHIKKTKHY